MKIAGGISENNIVVGNVYDKYGSRNPVVKRIMEGFIKSLNELISKTSAQTIHEIGCGEGYWVLNWITQGYAAKGSDFSEKVVKIARENAQSQGLHPSIFQICSIYDLDPAKHSADLIVCCEVLEHLKDPLEGLKSLVRVVDKYLLISVPREPLWRLLNLIRGKYVMQWGNTPGHLQHWSRSDFIRLVAQYFYILEIKNPWPWTMLLCRAKTDSF